MDRQGQEAHQVLRGGGNQQGEGAHQTLLYLGGNSGKQRLFKSIDFGFNKLCWRLASYFFQTLVTFLCFLLYFYFTGGPLGGVSISPIPKNKPTFQKNILIFIIFMRIIHISKRP